MNLREEYRTGSIRGLMAGAFAAAVVFFTNWTGDIDQDLIRNTVLAGLLAAGPFFGFGVKDARTNDRASAPAPTRAQPRAHGDPPPGEAGRVLDWRFMLGYGLLGGGLIALELIGALNSSAGDTISEAAWTGLDIGPVIWYPTLGAFLMFGVWLTRHLWWHRR